MYDASENPGLNGSSGNGERLLKLVETHYSAASKGRKPRAAWVMLRIYFLHKWNICLPWVGLGYGGDVIPDVATILALTTFRDIIT